MSENASAALEAVLFAEGGPVSRKRLAALLGIPAGEVTLAAESLRDALKNRGLALIETETELELRTAPAVSAVVEKLREGELNRDLGKAGLETLAIALYQNGATRSEIDWIRGVNSGQSVRSLLLRGLLEKSEDPKDKRRVRYQATTEALAHLGVRKKEELPRYAELARGTADAIAGAEAESQG